MFITNTEQMEKLEMQSLPTFVEYNFVILMPKKQHAWSLGLQSERMVAEGI